MNLDVHSMNFGAQVRVAPQSPKMANFSKKLQDLVKNATNAELLAPATSASAISGGVLATKFPYVASIIAASNSLLAGSAFIDARATKKSIAAKDALIKQTTDGIQEKDRIIREKEEEIKALQDAQEVETKALQVANNEEIKALQEANTKLAETNDAQKRLLQKNLLGKISATSLWSK